MTNGHLNTSSNHGHPTLDTSTTPNGSADASNQDGKKGEVVAAISPGMFLFLLSFLLTTAIIGLKRVQMMAYICHHLGPRYVFV